MVLTAEVPIWPNNVVEILVPRMKLIDPDLFVFKRQLQPSDPPQVIGIFGRQWLPNDQSWEMPTGQFPTIQRYVVMIQAFIQDSDEENGLAVHSLLTGLIRSRLATDDILRLGLAGLEVTMNGFTEKFLRSSIQSQSYNSAEVAGNFLYLSVTNFVVETQTA